MVNTYFKLQDFRKQVERVSEDFKIIADGIIGINYITIFILLIILALYIYSAFRRKYKEVRMSDEG